MDIIQPVQGEFYDHDAIFALLENFLCFLFNHIRQQPIGWIQKDRRFVVFVKYFADFHKVFPEVNFTTREEHPNKVAHRAGDPIDLIQGEFREVGYALSFIPEIKAKGASEITASGQKKC